MRNPDIHRSWAIRKIPLIVTLCLVLIASLLFIISSSDDEAGPQPIAPADSYWLVKQWEIRVHEVFVKFQLKVSDLHSLSVADLVKRSAKAGRLPAPAVVVLPAGWSLFDSPRGPTIRGLRRSLDSCWPEIRYLVTMYLLALHDEELPAILVDRFAAEQDVDVKIRIMRVLGETAYRPALTILADQVNSPRNRMTQEAKSSLVKFGEHATAAVINSLSNALNASSRAERISFLLKLEDNGKLDVLIPILNSMSEHNAVRSAACAVLAHFRYAEAISHMVAILAENGIRRTDLSLPVKKALQEFGEPGVQAILARIEQAEHAEYRANLIWALMRPHAESAIPVLTKCLQDKNVRVREHAIIALQQVEGVGSAHKLLPFLDDQGTRGVALLALSKLAKRSFGKDTDVCKRWWKAHLEQQTEKGHLRQLVGAIVRRANNNETQHFEALLDTSYKGQSSKLIEMIKESEMLSNYGERFRKLSDSTARLNYHDITKGCYFQIDVAKEDSKWKVTRIWFCR